MLTLFKFYYSLSTRKHSAARAALVALRFMAVPALISVRATRCSDTDLTGSARTCTVIRYSSLRAIRTGAKGRLILPAYQVRVSSSCWCPELIGAGTPAVAFIGSTNTDISSLSAAALQPATARVRPWTAPGA